MRVSSAFKPMHESCVNRHRFFRRKVRSVFQIIMLPFLFIFQCQSCQSTQILLTDCFINSSSSFNSLPIIISCISPPVRFLLDILLDQSFNRSRHTGNFPGSIRFPTSPCFCKMLHYSFLVFCSYSFRHSVVYISYHLRS